MDENRDEYIVLSTSYVTKNFQGGLSSSDHVSVGHIQKSIQVEGLKRLLRKLQSPIACFKWQRSTPFLLTDDTWYTGLPLGKNTIAVKMKTDFRESWFIKCIHKSEGPAAPSVHRAAHLIASPIICEKVTG